MIETKDILKKAKQLIQKGWIKGAFAKNANGRVCNPHSSEACQWCLVGAIKAVWLSHHDNVADNYCKARDIFDEANEISTKTGKH